ncbi:hypothetical protein RRG08_001595 [Elysia crispata]|uniref:Uncharacterized protein n=1 Tax=Elysia crispata TaxID=231223 RepID=A0AAE1AJX1_9GAST|nr:hypothetical protein RRG08_001595 [Elysia crispata]
MSTFSSPAFSDLLKLSICDTSFWESHSNLPKPQFAGDGWAYHFTLGERLFKTTGDTRLHQSRIVQEGSRQAKQRHLSKFATADDESFQILVSKQGRYERGLTAAQKDALKLRPEALGRDIYLAWSPRPLPAVYQVPESTIHVVNFYGPAGEGFTLESSFDSQE